MKMGKRWCAVLLSLMLLLGCLPASAMYEGEKSGYGLTPVSGSVSSAEPDGTWIFTTPEAKTAEAVGASLSIEGQPPLLVEEHSETEFYVTPSEALSGNTLYRFCWRDENETLAWAFQTQKRFAVSAVFPAQAATGVPVNSGIEITYNEDIFAGEEHAAMEDYFSITPAVEGAFEYHNNTAVFVPKGLDYGTVYTVVAAAGLVSPISGGRVAEDTVFSFETEAAPGSEEETEAETSLWLSSNYEEFSTMAAPAVDLWVYDNEKKSVDAKVCVYRYAEDQKAIQDVRAMQAFPVWASVSRPKDIGKDVQQMECVMQFTAEELSVYGRASITLPDCLEEGFYLLAVQCGQKTEYMVLQINDLPLQVISDADKTLVWVNSIKTGKAAGNAEVKSAATGAVYRTDENGLAAVTEPYERITELFVTSERERCIYFGVSDPYAGVNHYGNREDYWTVLQTDRSLYQKSDAVSLWGFAKPRQQGRDAVGAVTAVLSQGYWRDAHSILQKQTFTVENGVYSGTVALPSLSPGNYCITVYQGNYKEENNITLGQVYFEVADYQKPAYSLSAAADKAAIFAGESVNVAIKAAFYEGTPLPDLGVTYQVLGDSWDEEGHRYDVIASGSAVTDAEGCATVSFTAPPASAEYHGVEHTVYVKVTATMPELGEIEDECSIRTFQRDIAMEAEGERDGKAASVQVSLNDVTLERLLDGSAEHYGDYLAAPAADRKVKAEVYRSYEEKIQDGTEYDFIEKKNIPRYIYETKEEKIKTFTMTTDENGMAKEQWNLPNRDGERYYVALTAADKAGRTITQRQYLSERRLSYEEEGYRLDGAKWSYRDGDEVTLTLQNGKDTVKTGQTLFVKARNGIADYCITKNEYCDTFRKEDAPNFYVMAYYFDGRYYHSGYRMYQNLRYELEDEALTISVQTDRERYLPGDTCHLMITVKDRDGNPKQADLNLSVVDEAQLSLRDHAVDTLRDLYQNVGHGLLRSAATHSAEDGDMGRASGGIGGANNAKEAAYAAEDRASSKPEPAEEEGAIDARSDFRDTALFDRIRTNENGEAVYSFTLPDNITAWRLTLSGVTEDYMAGNLVHAIAVSQPMFINYALGSTFLTGDIPSLSVSAYGDGLNREETVNFTVYRKSNPEEKRTATAKAYQHVTIPLWEMYFAGEDCLVIAAQTEQGKQDSIEHPYRVIDGYRQKQTVNRESASAGMRISADSTGLSHVIFTDRGRGQYLYRLLNLCSVYGDRIEKYAAATAAKELIRTYFPDLAEEETVYFDPTAYQKEDGGAAMLPYAQSDLDLTVRLMPYFKDAWNFDTLRRYLYDRYEGENEDSKLCALYGLTQLGEPVLDDLQRFSEMDTMDAQDAIYLALAYLSLGETETASAIYDRYLLPSIEKSEPYAILSVGDSRDKIRTLTAQTAYLAAALQKPERDGLYRYSIENETEDTLINLEEVSYLKEALRDSTAETGSVTYRLFGDTKTADLKEFGSFVLTVPGSQMDELEILEVNGDVEVLTAEAKAIDADTAMDSRIQVKRRYYKVGDENATKELREGDLIRVNLWIDYSNLALDGAYSVTDYLPAGLAYVEDSAKMDENETGRFGRGCLRYAEADGQKVRFYDYNSRFYTGRLYYYYARVISPGTYRAEGTLVQSLRSRDSLTWGEDDLLMIR